MSKMGQECRSTILHDGAIKVEEDLEAELGPWAVGWDGEDRLV